MDENRRFDDAELTEEKRQSLIQEVLFTHLQRRSVSADVVDNELIAQYPKLMPELEDQLRVLREIDDQRVANEAMETTDVNCGDLTVRCPHCREKVRVPADATLSDISCSGCGSCFNLADDMTKTAPAKVTTIAHFELLDKVGTGTFGSVWKARDTELDRIVAVKIPRVGHLQQAEREQFLREARAAAQAKHPNIVSVHEVGRDGDTVYIVNDFIDGADLRDYLSGQPLGFRESVELCAAVADALHAAHEAGVVHRDLKPSNIMMDFAATPYVTDFGLAKREAGEITVTLEGQILGTPAYMAPEQIEKAHAVDRRADVYSLGVILYELLTGELPFRGQRQMLLLQIQRDEPAPPRKLNNRIPRDLETICLKAMAKEPARRYVTVAEMADDLQRYLDGKPIEARPIGITERCFRWCRRNPVVASLAATVVSLLLIVAIGSAAYSIRLTRHVESEQQARREAEDFFRITLDAIDGMLTTLSVETLEHVPHMDAVRKALLEKTVELQGRLLDIKPSHPALRLELAVAQHSMGNIYERLGELDDAKDAYESAIRLLQQLRASSPGEQVRFHLSKSHTMLGEVLRKTEPEDAKQHYETALGIQEELHRSNPENRMYRRELSRTLNNLGLFLTETGQYAKAEPALNDAIKHLRQLTREDDRMPDWLADLSRSQINLGFLLKKQSDRQAEAETAYREAVANLEMLVSRHPDHPEYKYKSAVAQLDLGNHLKDAPNGIKESVQSLRNSSSSLAELCEDHPEVPRYWYELANSHNSLANALAKVGDFDGVKEHFDTAYETLDQLAMKFPRYEHEVAKYQSLKGIVLGGLAAYEFQIRKDQNLEAAQDYVQNAIEHQHRATQLGDDNPTYVELLGGNHAYLAEILEKHGLAAQAEKERQASDALKARAAGMKNQIAFGSDER